MEWRISEKNSINLSLGTGYSAYAEHSEFNRVFMAPGSELSLDLYAGDFWISLHDRVSITEDAYEDPTMVGNANYSQFQNTAGLTVTWDLNKLVYRLGYDHVGYTVLSGGGGCPDGTSEIMSLSGVTVRAQRRRSGWKVAEDLSTTVETV